MSTIKIFLASSEELKPEREMMASLANSLNTVLEPQGIHVIVVEWENLDASMGVQHKQEDYNEKLRDCEMCLVLYWTKFGMYTKTELDTAYNELKAGNNPRKLYVYFKSSTEQPTEELKEFRDSFPTRYGHFFTSFENADTLKAHFLLQFMEYESQVLKNNKAIEIKDGKVVFGGVEYVNLNNVPFAGNNEEYNVIKDEIEELKEDLENMSPKSPRYARKAERLLNLREKLSKMENSLWNTALMITRLSTTKCSERLKRAMDLFTAGDNKGAQAVLNEEEIERDVEHNLHLIQLGEEGKKGLKINIEEYKLKIRTLENELCDDWDIKVYDIYKRCIDLAKNNVDDDEYASLVSDFGDFLMNEKIYDEVEGVYNEALSVYRKLDREFEGKYIEDIYWILRRLSNFYMISNQYTDANKILNEISEIIKDSDDSLKKAETLYLLAYLHYNQLNYEKAEDELNSAHILLSNIDNEEGRDKLTECLYLMGLLHKGTGKLDLAKDETEKAISVFLMDNSDVEEPFLSRAYELLGNIFSLKGDIPSALEMFQKSVEIIRELVKTDPNAYRLNLVCELGNLSFNHSLVGNFELAIGELHEAEEIITLLFEKYPLQYSEYYARVIHDYAYLLKNVKKYDEAIEIIEKGISAYSILKDSDAERHMFQLAECYNLQGCIYFENKKYEKAKEALTSALNIRHDLTQKFGNKYKSNEAQTLLNIAVLNGDTYQYEDSEKQFFELVELYNYLSNNCQQEHECNVALVYLNLAWLYQRQEKYEKAIKYGHKSIDTFKSVPDTKLRDRNQVNSLLAKALHNLSVVYFKLEYYENSLKYINEAIAICEKLNKIDSNVYEIQLSCVYNQIAWFKFKMHDFKNAEGLALQSLTIARQHDLKGNIRMSLDTLACIHRELGKPEAAIQEFNECIELCNELHDTNKQFFDGKLAHECIELAKIYKLNDSSKYDSLLLKAKNLLNNLDDNHKMDFREYFDDLTYVEHELK